MTIFDRRGSAEPASSGSARDDPSAMIRPLAAAAVTAS